MATGIIVVMALVIIVLAAYAGWLLYQLAQQRRAAQAKQAVQYAGPAVANQHNLGHRESIQVLARCVVQQQVSSTEAAIRITALARALPDGEASDEFYTAFANLANATAHIPILEAWQALDKDKRKAFEQERLEIEKAHHTQIMTAANALLTFQ